MCGRKLDGCCVWIFHLEKCVCVFVLIVHIAVLHRLTFSHQQNSVMSVCCCYFFVVSSYSLVFGFRFLSSFTNLKSVFQSSFVLINALVHINVLEKGSETKRKKKEKNEIYWRKDRKKKNQPELTIFNIYFSQRFISSVLNSRRKIRDEWNWVTHNEEILHYLMPSVKQRHRICRGKLILINTHYQPTKLEGS